MGNPRFNKTKELKICSNCGKFFYAKTQKSRFCSDKCCREFCGFRRKATESEIELAAINEIARKSEHKTYGKYTAWLRARFRPEDPKKHFGF